MSNILFIDNYDSFAHTIAAYLSSAGGKVTMLTSDSSMESVKEQPKDMIILGPGPNGPEEAGNYLDVIEAYHRNTPLLGICLGFQALVSYFGGHIHPLPEAAHGMPAKIEHDRKAIFKGIPSPAVFARYHSLGTYVHELPEILDASAMLDSIVMGVRHKEYPIMGVQFHPESVLSGSNGKRLIENIVRLY